MEIFVEKINEKEVVFPKNFTYTKTNDGFILNTLSGIEFFRNGLQDKIAGIGTSILGACLSIFLVCAYCEVKFNVLFYLAIPTCIGALLWAVSYFMKNIKTTFIVSPKGIEIKSKKDSLFIKKENISNIYAAQCFIKDGFNSYVDSGLRLRGVKSYLKDYKVFLVCKEPITLPNTEHCEDKFDLFNSHFFYTKKSAVFFVQEFIRVLDLNLNVFFMGDED